MIDDKVHWIDVLPLCLHSFFATFNNFEKWSSHPLNIGVNFLKTGQTFDEMSTH